MPTIEELKNTYSKFSNSKLSNLLAEIDKLSPVAQKVLSEEIAKRGELEKIYIEPELSDSSKISKLPTASLGKRILNQVIDYASFQIFLLVFFVFGGDVFSLFNNFIFEVFYIIFICSFPFINYIYLEGKYGKSIGKFVTKTTVYRFDETKISYKDSFIRTICRFIPFELLFIFLDDSLALHDRISKTFVKED